MTREQTLSETPSKSYRPRLMMRLILRMTRYVKYGTCVLTFPDGSTRTIIGTEDPDAMHAECTIHNDRLASKVMIRGVLGFCEAYLDGDWSSPDMTTLFSFALRNENALQDIILGMEWWRKLEGLWHKLRMNSRSGSKRNIAHHYDLGNDFYRRWLDHSMTYSAAMFDDEPQSNDTLYHAQQKKYAHIADMLQLTNKDSVLEIGCGWGGFAEYAAREIGCHITGLTISQAQHDYAVRRMKDAGLEDKVKIELRDYRDSDGVFDKIVSIEMFEAVGQEYWKDFFDIMQQRLRPGGLAAMQVITIAERHFEPYRRGADYIQKYIFPGGLLPTFSHLQQEVFKAGMKWRDHKAFGGHYARTLQEWLRRFTSQWAEIKPLGFDERFRRMWEQYMCYCAAGFKENTVNVYQFSFMKPS